MFTHDYTTDKNEDTICPPKSEIENSIHLDRCYENGKLMRAKMNSFSYIVSLNDSTKEIAISKTLRGCSTAIMNYQSFHNLGASEYYSLGFGDILHPTLGKIAHVSYNGRIWKKEKEEITEGLDEILTIN